MASRLPKRSQNDPKMGQDLAFVQGEGPKLPPLQNEADIENLIKKVKNKVYEKTNINLELEIKIVGE